MLIVWKYSEILRKSNGDFYFNKNIKTELLIPLEWASLEKRVNLKDNMIRYSDFKEEFSKGSNVCVFLGG